MADEVGANPQDAAAAGAGSPPENPAQNEPQNNTSAETQKPESSVPFNEDPRIQDYLRRQEDKIREDERRRWEAVSQAAQPKVDPIAQIEADLDARVKAQTATTKDIIYAARRIAEITSELKVSARLNPIDATVGEMNQRAKLDAHWARVGMDKRASIEPKMIELYGRLTPEQKKFYASDPTGINSLYLMAKELLPNPVPSQNPQNGASIPNRAGNKLPAGNDDMSRASNALVNKDKKAYEEIARKLMSQNR